MQTPFKQTNVNSSENKFEIGIENTIDGISVAVVSFFGDIHLKELVDSCTQVLDLPDFVRNMPACFDFSQAMIDIDINSAEILFHYNAGIREKRGKEYQLALVFGDEMTKTLVDFYRLLNAMTNIDIDIFDGKEKAMNWLNRAHSFEIPTDIRSGQAGSFRPSH